jgi:hypothetical protein
VFEIQSGVSSSIFLAFISFFSLVPCYPTLTDLRLLYARQLSINPFLQCSLAISTAHIFVEYSCANPESLSLHTETFTYGPCVCDPKPSQLCLRVTPPLTLKRKFIAQTEFTEFSHHIPNDPCPANLQTRYKAVKTRIHPYHPWLPPHPEHQGSSTSTTFTALDIYQNNTPNSRT